MTQFYYLTSIVEMDTKTKQSKTIATVKSTEASDLLVRLNEKRPKNVMYATATFGPLSEKEQNDTN